MSGGGGEEVSWEGSGRSANSNEDDLGCQFAGAGWGWEYGGALGIFNCRWCVSETQARCCIGTDHRGNRYQNTALTLLRFCFYSPQQSPRRSQQFNDGLLKPACGANGASCWESSLSSGTLKVCFWWTFPMVWMLALPQYPQHAKSYRIVSKAFLELMMLLYVIFYGLGACSAIASPIFKIFQNIMHNDLGTRNVPGCH